MFKILGETIDKLSKYTTFIKLWAKPIYIESKSLLNVYELQQNWD